MYLESTGNNGVSVKTNIISLPPGLRAHFKRRGRARKLFQPLPLIKPLSLTFYCASVLAESREFVDVIYGGLIALFLQNQSIAECTCLLHLPDQSQEV